MGGGVQKKKKSRIKRREEIREGRSERRLGREERGGKYYQQEGRSGGGKGITHYASLSHREAKNVVILKLEAHPSATYKPV